MPEQNPIRSMTGFASVEGEVQKARLRIEIKTVNHRFLDARIKLPRELASAEHSARQWLQSKLRRGTIELRVEKLSSSEEPVPFELNLTAARNYFQALGTLSQALGRSNDVSIAQIAQFPDVIGKTSNDAGSDETWKSLEPIAEKALQALVQSRELEGEKLRTALLGTTSAIGQQIDSIRAKREATQREQPQKLREKLMRVFQAYPIQDVPIQSILESRVAQELALIADRIDVEEELTRFRAHLTELESVIRAGGTIGKKLEFVLQELGREINTLGNKAQDFGISREVVEIKVSLEQMREQVLNLE